MDAKSILALVVIGLLAGWLASFVVGGGGLIRYIVTGLIGSFVGGWLFNAAGLNLGLGNKFVEQVIVSAVGAIVVVLIARLLA